MVRGDDLYDSSALSSILASVSYGPETDVCGDVYYVLHMSITCWYCSINANQVGWYLFFTLSINYSEKSVNIPNCAHVLIYSLFSFAKVFLKVFWSYFIKSTHIVISSWWTDPLNTVKCSSLSLVIFLKAPWHAFL